MSFVVTQNKRCLQTTCFYLVPCHNTTPPDPRWIRGCLHWGARSPTSTNVTKVQPVYLNRIGHLHWQQQG